MATRLIAYDLNSLGQDYDALIEAIKELGSWWHHLDSTWLVMNELEANDIHNWLAHHLDAGDELLIVDITEAEAEWREFQPRANRWLKETWN